MGRDFASRFKVRRGFESRECTSMSIVVLREDFRCIEASRLDFHGAQRFSEIIFSALRFYEIIFSV